MKNDPLKKVENYHGWKYLPHCRSSSFCLWWWYLFFSLVPAPFHVLISSFIIHYILQHLTAGDGQMHPDTTVVEFFYFYLCGVNHEAALQSWTEAEERNPSLLPCALFPCRKLHQQHNYLHWRRLFETQSPRVILSVRQHVQYTGAQNAENVRAVASHRQDGTGIIDKGNIFTAAQS